jgi:hypothetical protein
MVPPMHPSPRQARDIAALRKHITDLEARIHELTLANSDLEDDVESARANCEREQAEHLATRALVPPEQRPGPRPTHDIHLTTPKGE